MPLYLSTTMPSPAAYLDSHLHLPGKFPASELPALLERAARAGVERMFSNATQEQDWQAVIDLAAGHKAVIPFAGIHPWFAESAGDAWETRLRSLLHEVPAGIGEIGLDKKCCCHFDCQRRIFLAQLGMAAELGRPVVIHCVKAWGALLEILEQEAGAKRLPPTMIHSFAGSLETLRRLLRCGCFLSFSCRIMGEEKLHPCFLGTPLDKLLLETDALGQVQKTAATGADNPPVTCDEPAAIIELYTWAAAMRKMELAELRQQIWNNGKIFADTILPR